MHKSISTLLIIIGVITASIQPAPPTKTSITLNSLVGSCTVTEPVIIKLLQSKGLQRLKKIAVGGIAPLATTFAHNRSRYDHSVGVFMLLRNQKCSLIEQIAGLLHDVSHTVFSHVGNLVFDYDHDSQHIWFLKQTDIAKILEKYGIELYKIDQTQNSLPGLEQALPEMCADRLDYTINTAFLLKFLSKADVKLILKHLHLKNGVWFFSDIDAARKLAYASIFIVNNLFGNPANIMAYHWTASALKRAIEIDLLTQKDVRFGTDKEIWQKLNESTDDLITRWVHMTKNCENIVSIGSAEEFNMRVST
ncbi:HD domain-containing protein, partial [Candidatus Babeliales bacterium]|nr:HD domain-containing protein [Candidatus Babeliales bacterium]